MQKLYYSISQVSELVDEEQHILRYWEKEFEQLKPKKNRGGNRIYSEKDVQVIKIIKKLIRSDKLSLRGAKENLEKILSETNNLIVHSNEKINSEQPILRNFLSDENNSKEIISVRKEDLKEILETFKAFSLYLEKY